MKNIKAVYLIWGGTNCENNNIVFLSTITGLDILIIGMPAIIHNTSYAEINIVWTSHKTTKKYINVRKARKNLKIIISTPMEKQNYLNLENKIMKSAK